jgi:hypothetical protein
MTKRRPASQIQAVLTAVNRDRGKGPGVSAPTGPTVNSPGCNPGCESSPIPLSLSRPNGAGGGTGRPYRATE